MDTYADICTHCNLILILCYSNVKLYYSIGSETHSLPKIYLGERIFWKGFEVDCFYHEDDTFQERLKAYLLVVHPTISMRNVNKILTTLTTMFMVCIHNTTAGRPTQCIFPAHHLSLCQWIFTLKLQQMVLQAGGPLGRADNPKRKTEATKS